MTRLPIWKTSLAAIALVATRPGAFLRLGWPVLAVLVLLQALTMALGAGDYARLIHDLPQVIDEIERATEQGSATPDELNAMAQKLSGTSQAASALGLLGMIANLVGSAMLCVVWSRYVVLGDDAGGRRLHLRFRAAEIEMIGVLVILMVGGAVAMLVAFVISLVAVSLQPVLGYGLMCVLYTGLFFTFFRLTLLVPHVARDGGIDPAAVWRLTRGQTLPIFAIYGVVSLAAFVVCALAAAPFVLVILWHGAFDGFAIVIGLVGLVGLVVNAVLNLVGLLLCLVAAGLAYGQLAPVPALPEQGLPAA